MTPGELVPRPRLPRSRLPRLARTQPLVLVGLGGAVGSISRHAAVSTSANTSVVVFVLNVCGSLALGGLAAWLEHAPQRDDTANGGRDHWSPLFGLGFCGGLTTFSTHVVDVARRLDATPTTALVSLLGTALVAVTAAATGYSTARRLALRHGSEDEQDVTHRSEP